MVAVPSRTEQLQGGDPASGLPARPATLLVAEVDPETAVGELLAAHGGNELNPRPGGGIVGAFASAAGAVASAVALRRVVRDDQPTRRTQLRVALHTGDAGSAATVRRCERLVEIANWGQLLISSEATSVVGEVVPAGCRLHDTGTHRLRDLSYPERVFEVRQGDPGEEPAPLCALDC
jgi:class 3 adenylate cyclase